MSKEQTVTIDPQLLFAKGIFVQKMTPPTALINLIKNVVPKITRFELIRIGSDADGGYLIPNDLDGVSACFSPGVDTNASFESDLKQKFNIGSHLADYSVSSPPANFVANSFTKKFIGAVNNDIFMTLDYWLAQQDVFNDSNDLLLQMDIEGAEYASILSLNEDNLKRFRILLIEFHNIDNWGDPVFFKIVSSVFEKLLKNFIVVHNHPNNCCGLVNLGGIIAPRVFELTFLRRDRSEELGNVRNFPHHLDRPNIFNRDDLILPQNWYNF